MVLLLVCTYLTGHIILQARMPLMWSTLWEDLSYQLRAGEHDVNGIFFFCFMPKMTGYSQVHKTLHGASGLGPNPSRGKSTSRNSFCRRTRSHLRGSTPMDINISLSHGAQTERELYLLCVTPAGHSCCQSCKDKHWVYMPLVSGRLRGTPTYFSARLQRLRNIRGFYLTLWAIEMAGHTHWASLTSCVSLVPGLECVVLIWGTHQAPAEEGCWGLRSQRHRI